MFINSFNRIEICITSCSCFYERTFHVLLKRWLIYISSPTQHLPFSFPQWKQTQEWRHLCGQSHVAHRRHHPGQWWLLRHGNCFIVCFMFKIFFRLDVENIVNKQCVCVCVRSGRSMVALWAWFRERWLKPVRTSGLRDQRLKIDT